MDNHYDIAILGGAFSGSSLSLLLKRAHPHLKILVVERSEQFDRKVGESTSEVAGCFLTKVLHLNHYLSREHITKHGLRMWFYRAETDCPGECSEIGAYYQVRLPTYQLDRSTLDAHLLEQARLEGITLWRPAQVRQVELGGWGKNALEIKRNGQTEKITADWIIDASGKASLIARQEGYWKKLENHPVNAIWARFRHVADLDGAAMRAQYPSLLNSAHSPRATATNHLMGEGWWCWIIPLKNGDVSAGLVYDERLYAPPEGKNLGERLHRHLLTHPMGRALFSQAEMVEKDIRTYSHLPYYSTHVAGPGWATIGDAAGFMDPLYSQGLDYCSHSTYTVFTILDRVYRGESRDEIEKSLQRYDREYPESYHRWFEALYLNKYQYLGDAKLMEAAFLLDIGTYFIGPVRLVYEKTEEEFALLPYHGTAGKIAARFMAFYNRRLARLGTLRRQLDIATAYNTGRRLLVREGFIPSSKVMRTLFRGLRRWWACEIETAWARLTKKKVPQPTPSPGLTRQAKALH